MQTLTLHFLQGLFAPFSFSSKRFPFLFEVFKRGLDTACKMEKIRENQRVFQIKYLLATCKRVADCLQSNCKKKVIKYRLEQIACRNPQITCNANNVSNTLLGELNLKFKTWKKV
jgi:hypothetical protein